MPRTSKDTATRIEDIGIGTMSQEFMAGYEYSFLCFRERGELAPFLKGLPDDMCTCPHWGHVTTGSITFTHLDGSTETFTAGDAFYVEPGHTPVIEAGTEVLFISPEKQIAAVNAVIEANMAAMAGAH